MTKHRFLQVVAAATFWAASGAGAQTGASTRPTINGFVSNTLAYTTDDPKHWSRAVTRLQLSSTGELGGGFKWRIGGRVDADPVYTSDGFYRSEVRRDQRLNAFWRETYLDFSKGNWDFRLGAQNIVWGEVVGLFFADVVSRRDLREFVLPSFDILRKPQWAARAEYTAGDSHLELVWVPVQTFDDIGKPGSDFYPLRLPTPTSDADASIVQNPDRPSRSLRNSAFGGRVSTVAAGWDMAAFYYRSHSALPTFYRAPIAGPTPFVFQPRYDRISQTGATVSKDFTQFVLRGEAVYTSGQRHALTDFTLPDAAVERSTVDYVVGLDFTLPYQTRLNVQGFQRVISGGESDLALKTGGFGGSVLLASKVTATLEPQILWVQSFQNAGGMVRPRLNWYAAKNATIAVGVDVFTGASNGFFGRYGNRDRVYTEMRYSF